VALMKAQDTLMHAGGELIVQPLSAEDEIPFETIEPQIQQALRTAATQGVIGKDTTPFLLAHLNEITSGRSQAANRALAIANARLAGEIAMRYAGNE